MERFSIRFFAAVLLGAIGIVALFTAQSYEFGTANRMGPGFFPTILAAILTVLAVTEAVSALMAQPKQQDVKSNDWRALAAILASVTGFALSITAFGLIPAFCVAIGFATRAERNYGLLPAVILAGAISVGAWLVFSRLLGMTLPLFALGF